MAGVIAKIFTFFPDAEETLYSKSLDGAIADFFKAACELDKIITAASEISRAFGFIKSENRVGNRDTTNSYSLQGMFFCLHFIELGKSVWPKLQTVKIPLALDEVKDDPWTNVEKDGRLKILKDHVQMLQAFLGTERARHSQQVNSSLTNLLDLARELASIRFRVLETRLAGTLSLSRSRASQITVNNVFYRDVKALKDMAGHRLLPENENAVGRAAGQVYLNVTSLWNSLQGEALPTYDEVEF
ncbi:hypothetical protein BC830DRAFT_1101237 [Chytriomyces sp. MP71]|nr:hypothetical protein BC830DRAFT_1101237 [Chytriomyces sp. MP71]